MTDEKDTGAPSVEPGLKSCANEGRTCDCSQWRRDFPINWSADNYTTRREFSKFLALASGGAFVGSAFFPIAELGHPNEKHPVVDIAGIEDISVGGVRLFRYPTSNDPAMLIRLTKESWTAYLQRCTHLSCPVYFTPQTGRIECPCHNGAFDVSTGQVLEGPPPRPLPRIVLRVSGGRILACGIEDFPGGTST